LETLLFTTNIFRKLNNPEGGTVMLAQDEIGLLKKLENFFNELIAKKAGIKPEQVTVEWIREQRKKSRSPNNP
jgi:hypothetical protein